MSNTNIKAILEACAMLPADQLDEFIQAIGLLRANAEPAIQMMPDALAPAADDPALTAGVRADGRLDINIRSPAFGWQKFTLSHHNTAAIGKHLILTKPIWEQAQHLTVHDADGPLM